MAKSKKTFSREAVDFWKKRYNEQIEELSKKYYVEDLVDKNTKLVFWLESPHIQELVDRVPAAGGTGKAMGRHLLKAEHAKLGKKGLGLLLKKNKQHYVLKKIGIMNVCNIPMQASALKVKDRQKYAVLYKIFEKLRKCNPISSPEMQAVHELLVEMMSVKLEELKGRSIVFVPCGCFAQEYFRISNTRKNVKTVQDVPHPAFGWWTKREDKVQVAVDLLY